MWNLGKRFWLHTIFFFFLCTLNSKNVDYVLCAKNKRSVTMHEHVKMIMKTNCTKNYEYENCNIEGLRFLMSFVVNLIGKLRKAFKILWIRENSRRKLKFLQSSTEEECWVMVSVSCEVALFSLLPYILNDFKWLVTWKLEVGTNNLVLWQ